MSIAFRNLLLGSCLVQALGCATVGGLIGLGGDDTGKGEEDVEAAVATPQEQKENEVDNKRNVRPATKKELELKLAKLWGRVNELEHTTQMQKQRLKVIERGLLLGIVPDELKHAADRMPDRAMEHSEDTGYIEKKGKMMMVAPSEPPTATQVEAKKEPQASQRDKLIEAQRLFEKGDYGRAIAAYSTIEASDGSPKYWIALSWSRLKVYETAHKEFREFVASYPDSPWIPRAKFHLAEVDFNMGYRTRALDQLREVITKYPEEDAAQMAKNTLVNMEGTL